MMRTRPNRNHLRHIALMFLGVGVGLIICSALLVSGQAAGIGLALGAGTFAQPALAAALWFWALSRDCRAGIVVDGKGLVLNLGTSSAFIAWANIERVGVTWHCTSMLALGSRRQLGISLRDVLPYVQSYEQRVPVGPGPLEWGLRLVRRMLRERYASDNELALHLGHCRRRTGFDVLIPEALLGQPAAFFAELIDDHRGPARAVASGSTAWAAR
jgi:hypothetical protein